MRRRDKTINEIFRGAELSRTAQFFYSVPDSVSPTRSKYIHRPVLVACYSGGSGARLALTADDLPQTFIHAGGFDTEPLTLVHMAVCRSASSHVV